MLLGGIVTDPTSGGGCKFAHSVLRCAVELEASSAIRLILRGSKSPGGGRYALSASNRHHS